MITGPMLLDTGAGCQVGRAMMTVAMCVGNRVISLSAEGMASREASQRQPAPFQRAVNSQRLHSIGGTGWIVTTARRQQGRYEIAIYPDREREQKDDSRFDHRVPRSAEAAAPTLSSASLRSAVRSSKSRLRELCRPIRTKSQPRAACSGIT